jgi:hypothetical protein
MFGGILFYILPLLQRSEHPDHPGSGVNVPLVVTYRVVGEDTIVAPESPRGDVENIGTEGFTDLVFVTQGGEQVV